MLNQTHNILEVVNLKRLLTLLLCVLMSISVSAQDDGEEEEGCGAEPTDKKVLKLLTNAENKKKYDARQRYMFLKEAVEIDEECAKCYYELGKRSFNRAKGNGGSYSSSQEWFKQLIDFCPEYHTDPYYYLGVSYYAQKNWKEALKYFRDFLKLTDLPDDAYARNWQKKYDDVKDILGEVVFYAEIMENPVPFDPKKVEGVSTAKDEYLPMLSPDNELLFYTRKWDKKERGDIVSTVVEQLTASNRTGDVFDKGEKMPTPFNVPNENYGGVTISADNKEMYITVCKYESDPTYKNCDIYVSRYKQKQDEETGNYFWGWTELERLGPEINTPDGWESQPTLSGDGQRLFFTAAREGTERQDIMMSTRGTDNAWGTAKPLAGINTAGDDKSPYIHSDSQTLYFASNGRFGMGGYDLYYTKFKEGVWSEPKNIGIPINTEHDELGLFVSTDGKLAYFSSNRISGSEGYDIYNFELHKGARPERILLVKGQLKDEKGEVVEGATIELTYAETKQVQHVNVDSADGRYAAVIQIRDDEDVIMTVKKEGHAMQSKLFEAEAMDSVYELEEHTAVVQSLDDIKVEKLQTGKAFRINDVRFETNRAELSEKAMFILDQFAIFMKENPTVVVSIDGHTDNRGDAQENLALSTERAFSVKEYLERQGVKGSRLKWHGYGESKPLSTNDTAAGRANNRRTEFTILKK